MAEYPKALYHATAPVALVHDPDQHALLGPGWFESPDEAAAAAVAETAPAGEATGEPTEAEREAAEIVALNAKDAIEIIGSLTNLDVLAAVRAIEKRSTVLAALQSRRDAL